MAHLNWFGLAGRMLLVAAVLSVNNVACSSSSGGGGATAQGGDSSAAGGDTGAAGAPAQGACTRGVIANWTAEGQSYESDFGLYSSVGDTWLYNITSCAFPLHVIQMSNLPAPLALGTIPIDSPIVGAKMAGHGAAEYIVDTNKNIGYLTDADHTGTLTITDVTADPPSWSADFSFSGALPDGSKTVDVTGHIVNATYKP